MSVHANIKRSVWDSEFFASSIATLTLSNESPVLNEQDLHHYQLIQAKISMNDYDHLLALQQLNFQLVEGEIDLLFSNIIKQVKNSSTLQQAEQHNIPELKKCAANSFQLSRFREPWFCTEKSAELYSIWVEKAVLGQFDDDCLVIKAENETIKGFITLRQLNAGAARIGLLAVNPDYQGQGIGQYLIQQAFVWCKQHQLNQLYVSTQSSNLAALRLYIKCGATISDSAYWLYRLNRL